MLLSRLPSLFALINIVLGEFMIQISSSINLLEIVLEVWD